MIQEDSYWYIDISPPKKIKVMCVKCFRDDVWKEKYPHANPWFWHGLRYGYGDYDCYCSLCGRAICEREPNVKT